MSTPKAPVDNSAQIARQQEEERQARIAEGRSAIDDAFSSYNDDFYNQYQTDYTNYYTPQLTDQYDDAHKRLTLQLAKTGNLTSSYGIDRLADIEEYYGNQNTALTNRALDAVNTLKGNVDQRKSQLYADNRSAADPGSASTAAIEAAGALQPTQPQSPLANVFADFFNNVGNAAAISNTAGGRDNTGVQTYYGGSNSSVQNY